VHTNDTAGGQLATYLAAIQSGGTLCDGAAASLSGTTSQPSLSAIVAATDHSRARRHGVSLQAVSDLEPYWETVRRVYYPFGPGCRRDRTRVPARDPRGQLSNLRTQAKALGLGEPVRDIETMYAAADPMLGRAGEGDTIVQSGR